MSTAKVIEVISISTQSFDDAIRTGIAEAATTLRGLHSAWVKDQSCCIKNNKIVHYKVILKLTFEVDHQS